MRGRRNALVIALTIGVLLVVSPAAFARSAVTIDRGLAAEFFSGSTSVETVAVSSSEAQERSCEAGRTKSRVRVGPSNRLGQVERKGAVVACEQPPRSSLNITGLKDTESNAIAAAG